MTLTDGPGGVRAGPFPVASGTTIAIGERDAVHAALDKALPDGPWTATIALQSGTVRRTARVVLTFRGQTAVPVAHHGPRWGPILLAVAVVLLALLLGSLAVRSRRRPARA